MKRAVCMFFAAILGATTAHADTPPSAWDRAKDPNAAAAYALHVNVHRILEEARFVDRVQPFVQTDMASGMLRRAIDQLERFGAERSNDVRLRFDLGIAYEEIADHEVDRKARYQKAVTVLRSALAAAPDHPAAEDAFWYLAVACGKIGDTTCERNAYVEVLKRRTEEEGRATPSLNLAETEMHLGNLRESIEGYRETIRLAAKLQGDGVTAPLAMWGLAVALDRSGDHVGAEREAKAALELELSSGWRRPGVPRLIHSRGVFFYPEYEIYWYDGLESVMRARTAKTAREAVDLMKVAEISFGKYVEGADRDKDRWLDIARARLASAKADREKAEKRAVREPKPVVPVVREEQLTF